MRFDEIWTRLVNKKPALAQDNSTVEFTASNLRQLLRQVYEQGERASEKAKAATPPSPSSILDDIFRR